MKEFKANLPSCHELSNALRLALHKFLMTKKDQYYVILFLKKKTALLLYMLDLKNSSQKIFQPAESWVTCYVSFRLAQSTFLGGRAPSLIYWYIQSFVHSVVWKRSNVLFSPCTSSDVAFNRLAMDMANKTVLMSFNLREAVKNV